MGVEGFGLSLAAIATLAVPVRLTTKVDDMTGGTIDRNLGSGERDKRSRPFFVAECRRTGECYLVMSIDS